MNTIFKILVILLMMLQSIHGQQTCEAVLDAPRSDRIANYEMEVYFDAQKHLAKGRIILQWINNSPEEVEDLRFYMYLNAFKNEQSTWMRGRQGRGGDDLADRPESDWGDVKMINPTILNRDIEIVAQQYIQPDDGNPLDETVLQLELDKPLAASDTLILEYGFEAKLPRTLARSGFERDSMHHFVHWYPKIGVWEQNRDSIWNWNCHQFFSSTEFYGDFGVYDVMLNVPSEFVLGHSGCLAHQESQDDSRTIYKLYAADVIDFAWVAYPYFNTKKRTWRRTDITLLYPKEHEGMSDRYLDAMVFALDYLAEHLGEYPYTTLTAMDPPFHALRNGFMEYPTYITGGTVYGMPKCITSSESLIIHELCHQYFMAVVATNEKENAWMDEGFTTYYEDRIMAAYKGEKTSIIDCAGYHFGNRELSRNEYVDVARHTSEIPNQPGWEFESSYKPIVYSKVATMFYTLEKYLGSEVFDEILSSYYRQFAFRHPSPDDFIAFFGNQLSSHGIVKGPYIEFINNCINTNKIIDWSVRYEEETSEFIIENNGSFSLPLMVLITYDNGEEQRVSLTGTELNYSIPALSGQWNRIEIDPQQRLYMDTDFTNNSLLREQKYGGDLKYSSFFSILMMVLFQFFNVL